MSLITNLNPNAILDKSIVKQKLSNDIFDNGNLINVTYSELVSLRDNSKLKPGCWYRIIDYVTTTSQENTRSAGHQFDVLVLATDVNILSEEAKACQKSFNIENFKDAHSYTMDTKMIYNGTYEYDGKIYYHYKSQDYGDTVMEMLLDFNNLYINGQFTENEYPHDYYPTYGKFTTDENWEEGNGFGENICFKTSAIDYFASSNLNAWKIWYCLDNDESRFAWVDNIKAIQVFDESVGYTYIYKRDEELDEDGKYAWVYVDEGDNLRFDEINNWESVDYGDVIFTNTEKLEIGTSLIMGSHEVELVSIKNGKGVIYRMIDEWGNDCSYDFKNIMFNRKLTDGVIDNENGVDTFVYTFSWIDTESEGEVYDFSIKGNNGDLKTDEGEISGCYGNEIGNYRIEFAESNKIQYGLNDNVFISNYLSNEQFGTYNNKLLNNCRSNTFGNSCNSNLLGNGCSENSFGDDCYSNSFGVNCYSNSFGIYCSYNSFGNYCNSNTFGEGCEFNSFDESCDSNSFGDNCSSNSFGDYCQFNSFGSDCHSNSFGDYCQFNSFGSDCHSNSFGSNCNSNSFGDDCHSNSFGDNCSSNSFGNGCLSNSFGNDCSHNQFGDDCYYNSFDDSCCSNSFSNYCESNLFGNYCDSNSFGNSCSFNIFGNNCQSNSFGNSCSSNSFDNSCYDMIFGDECHSNSFGNSCNSNSFENNCYSNSFGNSCSENSFENNCYSNSFGNDCSGNSFGVECYSNIFGNNCSNNSFEESCVDNSFGNECCSNTFVVSCYSNSFGGGCNHNSFGVECYYNTFGEGCNYNSFKMSASKDGKLRENCCNNIFKNGVSHIILYNTSTASDSYRLQNVTVCQGMSGTAELYNFVEIPSLNAEYQIKVAKNTNGDIIVYNEADLIFKG